MSDDNLTVRVLIDIRDELRELRQDVKQTNVRLDSFQTEVRDELRAVRSELAEGLGSVRAEIAEVDIRAATRALDHTAATRDLYDLLRDRFEMRDRVEKCEREIEELKRKVG